MKKRNKIDTTYKEWFDGMAVHFSTTVYNVNPAELKFFDWKNVSEEDAKKIKNVQEKIAKKKVSKLFDLWKKSFEAKINDYENASTYCSNEIHDFKTILQLGEKLKVLIENYNPLMVFLNHKELKFDEVTLFDIRTHVHDVLVLKKKKDYSFIHSPRFPHSLKGKMPDQLYAEAIYEYYLWLLEYAKKFEKASQLVELFSDNDADYRLLKDALKDLYITATLSDYQISGFVVASIESNVLPRKKAVDLLKLIYKEINKEIPTGLRIRRGTSNYHDLYKQTMEYYPQIRRSGNY
ncbi:MAG: hypothetical protein NT127_05755 [Sphingobacteriales bacterium]|nr:hypothetical protein [Sphingobacteriales bacterium]